MTRRACSLTLPRRHAIVGGPEPRPARGSAHEMPPVPAGEPASRSLPRAWGEAGAVFVDCGKVNAAIQNTARDW